MPTDPLSYSGGPLIFLSLSVHLFRFPSNLLRISFMMTGASFYILLKQPFSLFQTYLMIVPNSYLPNLFLFYSIQSVYLVSHLSTFLFTSLSLTHPYTHPYTHTHTSIHPHTHTSIHRVNFADGVTFMLMIVLKLL